MQPIIKRAVGRQMEKGNEEKNRKNNQYLSCHSIIGHIRCIWICPGDSRGHRKRDAFHGKKGCGIHSNSGKKGYGIHGNSGKKGYGAGHSYTWTIDTNAACTSPGLRTGACECGDRKTESITALGHSWGGTYTRIPAACTSSGISSHSCNRCSAVQDVGTISPLGHAWPDSYITIADNGTYYKNCKRCSTRLETKYNPYTITYFGNGNTGGSRSKSNHTYNTPKSLNPNGFTKQYHTFDSWNTRANGSGTKYTNGQNVNNLTAAYNGSIDLYAQWRRSSSLVTYKDWNGTTLKTQETAIGNNASPPGNPARTGYIFTGWDKSSVNIQDQTVFSEPWMTTWI